MFGDTSGEPVQHFLHDYYRVFLDNAEQTVTDRHINDFG
jgi:hypothetical protein